jgi:hypothetical protein
VVVGVTKMPRAHIRSPLASSPSSESPSGSFAVGSSKLAVCGLSPYDGDRTRVATRDSMTVHCVGRTKWHYPPTYR